MGPPSSIQGIAMNAQAQHTLASLFSDIQNSDPRMDQFGQNAHEFTFLNFAYPCFSDGYELTLSHVATVVETFLECVAENISHDCFNEAGECSEDVQEFIELLEVFNATWKAADFSSKTEFIEAQHAVIAANAKREAEMAGAA